VIAAPHPNLPLAGGLWQQPLLTAAKPPMKQADDTDDHDEDHEHHKTESAGNIAKSSAESVAKTVPDRDKATGSQCRRQKIQGQKRVPRTALIPI
jgi:hypothetical protein